MPGRCIPGRSTRGCRVRVNSLTIPLKEGGFSQAGQEGVGEEPLTADATAVTDTGILSLVERVEQRGVDEGRRPDYAGDLAGPLGKICAQMTHSWMAGRRGSDGGHRRARSR